MLLLTFILPIFRDFHKMCEKEQKQKQPLKNGANWAMDGTYIGANYKIQKLEFLVLILCILMAIICGTYLYATFFPSNSPNPGPSGEQKHGDLHKDIEALRTQIGQMIEERNLERNLQTIEKLRVIIGKQAEESRQMLEYENLHIGTIKDLRATVEQQAKEISQMRVEAMAQKALEQEHLQSIDELRAIVEKQQAKEKAAAANLQKKLYKLKEKNRWKASNRNVKISRDGLKMENTRSPLQHVYAEQGFDISGDSRKEDNFTGTIIYYFEVKQTSFGGFCTGLSDGSILVGSEHVGESPNSYGRPNRDFCWISGIKHAFEWPEGVNKPKWNGPSTGDVSGCGLLLSPDNKVAPFTSFYPTPISYR